MDGWMSSKCYMARRNEIERDIYDNHIKSRLRTHSP